MLSLFRNTEKIKKQKHNECPICLQEKKLTTQCIICTDTKICQDCCLSLCERGLCGKCPVCRQPNWKKPKKNQIVPIKNSDSLFNNNQGSDGGGNLNDIRTDIRSDNLVNYDTYPQYTIRNDSYCHINCYRIYINTKIIYLTVGSIIGLCMLMYAIGFFTVLIFTTPKDWKENPHLYWISGIIGLFWFSLLWCPCCCGNTLKNLYCS